MIEQGRKRPQTCHKRVTFVEKKNKEREKERERKRERERERARATNNE